MNSLKEVLDQDTSRLKKDEIVNILTKLNAAIGDAAYSQVSGIDVKDELPDLKKDDMVAVFNSFRNAYKSDWENDALRAGTDLINTVGAIAAADENLFSTQNNTVSSADFAAELGSIDFENLISGPMDAAVKAQANASMSTVSFIKEVGFDRDSNGDVTGLKMADFSYSKEVPNADNTGTVTEEVKIKVPFISILNVPSLRVETLDIDFHVKLNSTYKRDVTSSLGIDAEVSAGWGPVKMKVGVSYQRSASTGVKVEKEYSMGVKVRATNDEMPAGLEKVLALMSE